MRRARGAVLWWVIVAALVVVPAARARPAPPAGQPTSTTAATVPTQDIIPEPNRGSVPRDPGDRGGAGQLAVLGIVIGGVAVLVWLAARDVRRARSVTAPGGSGGAAPR